MRRDKTEIGRDVLSLVLALGVVALSYAFTSCTQEPPLSYDGEAKEYMDFSLELTPPGVFTAANTRAIMDNAQQNAVNRAVVLVYKDNILISQQTGTVTEVSGTGGVKKQITVSLKTSQSDNDLFDIMVIGNPPATFNFASYVNQSKSTLKSAFSVAVSGKWAGSEFVMYGEALQTLIKPTTNSFKIEMLRSLARVDIGLGAYDETTDTWAGLPSVFTLKEVRVVNSRDKFAVIPAATTFNESGNVKVSAPTIPAGTMPQGTTAADAITYSGSPDIEDTHTQSVIFLPEAPNDADRVTLLVGGSYMNGATTYYRIDMCVPRAGAPGSYDYLPILRNHLYRISITGVSGAGFTDPQEALLSAPINITTTLTPIAEGGTGDIIFDGNNYIQTDASSVQIYGTPDGVKTYSIGTVKANFVAGVAATVTGPGITAPINLPNGVARSISVVIPAGTTTGSYTIKVGRLSKVIPLSVQPAVDAHFDFLPFQNVANIRIDNPQPWLTLSQKNTYVKSEQQSSYVLGNSAGKACFHFDENIATTGNPRMASASVLRNNNSGTTRVVFEQLNLSGMLVGLFGGSPGDSINAIPDFNKNVFLEVVEEFRERVYDDTSIGTTTNGFEWGFYNVNTRMQNYITGIYAPLPLIRREHESGVTPPYTIYNNYAVRYCYDKNRDINGDGTISEAEILWYLPAAYQLLETHFAFKSKITGIYWSSTEAFPTGGYVANFDTSLTEYPPKNNKFKVRCVRELAP